MSMGLLAPGGNLRFAPALVVIRVGVTAIVTALPGFKVAKEYFVQQFAPMVNAITERYPEEIPRAQGNNFSQPREPETP
jgi:hypothetical protein